VVFLNAGDCFTDTRVLADVILKLNTCQSKPVDVLCCGANLVIESGKIVYRSPKKVEDYIWHGLPANHQATYYRRLMLEAQPYDPSFKICGDYFLAATLYKQKAFFAYLDRAVVEFFLNGISYSWRKELFMEPWEIQKNILSIGIGRRILSCLKRFMSNLALRIFSLPLMGRALLNIHSHIRSKK
jgi:putative colanic acid biosynthesis glycosyltransferase